MRDVIQFKKSKTTTLEWTRMNIRKMKQWFDRLRSFSNRAPMMIYTSETIPRVPYSLSVGYESEIQQRDWNGRLMARKYTHSKLPNLPGFCRVFRLGWFRRERILYSIRSARPWKYQDKSKQVARTSKAGRSWATVPYVDDGGGRLRHRRGRCWRANEVYFEPHQS